jgi:hypothetical protein
MKTAQMVMTAGLLNPETACSGVMSPVRASDTMTMRATTSTRTRSVTNRVIAMMRMPRTSAMSSVIRSRYHGRSRRT